MTNRDKLDRIIVKNNDRMNMVISWFYENKNWLDREEFKAPMGNWYKLIALNQSA